jgi:hypothetical protein
MNTTTKASLGVTVILLVISLIIAVQNMSELKSTRQAVVDRDAEIGRLNGLLAHEQDMNQKLVLRPLASATKASPALEARLNALEMELQNKTAEIAVQEEEKNMLVERVQKQEIVREKELTEIQKRIRDASSIGEVSEVQDQAGFAVISAGKDVNVEPGTRYAIRRNVFIVGKVEVTTAEDNYSIVDIVPGSVQPGLKIQKGDTVISYPVY